MLKMNDELVVLQGFCSSKLLDVERTELIIIAPIGIFLQHEIMSFYRSSPRDYARDLIRLDKFHVGYPLK